MKQSVEFEDLQPGDVATIKTGEYTVTGPVWRSEYPDIYLFNGLLLDPGSALAKRGFVSAYRERKLPTVPGSVITKIRADYVRHSRDSKTAVLGKDGKWWYVQGWDHAHVFTDWEEV